MTFTEERFLFPAYPLICLAAALSVDTIQKLWYAFLVKVHIRHYLDHTQWISYLFLALTTLLSVMRIVALYQNYHASMDIWRDLNHMSYSEESSYKPGKYTRSSANAVSSYANSKSAIFHFFNNLL